MYVNKHLVKGFKSMARLLGKEEKEKGVVESEWQGENDPDAKLRISKVFGWQVARMARNRQFCQTERSYMGWVPGNSKEGDVICLLEGGRLPYVLRWNNTGTGFQFIGEAYIHGVMHGEGMAFLGTEMRDILLH